MDHLRNLFKVFASFLVVVNLNISLDYVRQQDTTLNSHKVELLLVTENTSENDTINFNQLKKSFPLNTLVTIADQDNKKINCQIKNQNTLLRIVFRLQQHQNLKFKDALLQKLINEISIERLHCI